jgi:hypothetical protein
MQYQDTAPDMTYDEENFMLIFHGKAGLTGPTHSPLQCICAFRRRCFVSYCLIGNIASINTEISRLSHKKSDTAQITVRVFVDRCLGSKFKRIPLTARFYNYERSRALNSACIMGIGMYVLLVWLTDI